MFRHLLPLLALLTAGACMPAVAAPLVELAIVDRDIGQWLPQYRHHSGIWVSGVPGHRYSVRLTNTTGERVLVVLSVDGVNAISGDDASAVDPGQDGYVLAPWQSTDIAGWRKSLDDIAQFYFTDLPDSYAARTGRPDNVGVVGVAVFRERRVIRNRAPMPPIYRGGGESEQRAAEEASASPSAAMEDGVAAQRIGTGHGDREWAPVEQTDFVRASREPAQLTELRYDAPDRLAELGIVPPPYSSRWQRPPAPRAFPRGFVSDPPPRD